MILYVFGLLSCWVTYVAISAFYMGSLYRIVNLWVMAVSYAVFCVWPAAGRAIYEGFLVLSDMIVWPL